MNYVTKDLPKNYHVPFRQLNTFSTVRANMMERIYEDNKLGCNIFVLTDILKIEIFQKYSFVVLTCFSHL